MAKGLSESDLSGLSDILSDLMDVKAEFIHEPKGEAERLTKMQECYRNGGCRDFKRLQAEGKHPQMKRLCFKCMDRYYDHLHI